jgi:hypothetical protein
MEATINNHMVISIKMNQQKRVEKTSITRQESRKKMPVFNCSCGTKILIVPDLPAMNKALKKHQIEHKELTGKDIDEEILSQGILQAIIKSLSTSERNE